jgi:hypothetical protein
MSEKTEVMKTKKRKIFFFATLSLFIMFCSASDIQDMDGTTPAEYSDHKVNHLQEKSKYQFIGAEKCASVCHNNEKMGFQYDIWKTSPHSGAFNNLASKKAGKYAKKANLKENPQVSAVCLKCHITGYGLDSTYITVTYKRSDGVTCEACHKHEFVDKTYLPDEADCLKCHNNSVHKTEEFDFSEKSAIISHRRPIERYQIN